MMVRRGLGLGLIVAFQQAGGAVVGASHVMLQQAGLV